MQTQYTLLLTALVAIVFFTLGWGVAWRMLSNAPTSGGLVPSKWHEDMRELAELSQHEAGNYPTFCRKPYSRDIYSCLCGAKSKDDCCCAQAKPVIYLCGKQGIGKTRISKALAQLLGCTKIIGGDSFDDDDSQAIVPGTLVEGGFIEHIRHRVPGSIAIDVQDEAAMDNLISVLRSAVGSAR